MSSNSQLGDTDSTWSRLRVTGNWRFRSAASFQNRRADAKYRRQTRQPAYFLRWRIRARIRRFFLPTLRRPLPVFFVPTYSDLRVSSVIRDERV
ncbi:MAG: hypothetical protein EA381_17920 [Planctomycetaceae bacterium]|nr:MAG: hypothetical protein EA381_17920 [Planctomycetaceae bacterium]